MAGDEPSEGADAEADADASEQDASDEPAEGAEASGEPAGPVDGDGSRGDDPSQEDDSAVDASESDEGGGDDEAEGDHQAAESDEQGESGDDAPADADGADPVDVDDDPPEASDDGASESHDDGTEGASEGEDEVDEDAGESEEANGYVDDGAVEPNVDATGDSVDDEAEESSDDETEDADSIDEGTEGGGGDVDEGEVIDGDVEDDDHDDAEEVDFDELDDDPEGGESDAPGGLFGGGRAGGPAEDREMPLADHIREMLRRLAVVVAVAGLVSLLTFPFAEGIINFLWYSILPGVETDIARPRLYGVLELLFTKLKVASLAGLIVALPVMVYETYAFMRPGLYPHERRYYLAAVPTSLVLALVGVSFAYFVILPAIFVYFLYYSQDVATIGFALGRTFDLILLLMGYMAIVFQIPLFIMLAMMMGLVTRRWLAARRLLFWGAFLGISFLFSPDPTGMAPIIVAATMIVLFEGTLLLTKWTGRE